MNPILALVVANIAWGASSPIFKFAMETVPPFTLAFYRFFIAFSVLFPFVPWHESSRITKGQWVRIGIGSLLGLSINISLFLLGLQRTASINSAVAFSTGPIFLFIFAILVLHEKPRFKVLAGIITAVTGTLIVLFAPILAGGGVKSDVGGNLILLTASLVSVMGSIILKPVLMKINPILVSGYVFFIAALSFAPFAWHEWSVGQASVITPAGLLGIIYGSFTALAFFIFYYGLAHVNAQEVGIFSYLNPITTILIGWLFLHEYPGPPFVVGTSLVFVGISVAEQGFYLHHGHTPLHMKTKHGKL